MKVLSSGKPNGSSTLDALHRPLRGGRRIGDVLNRSVDHLDRRRKTAMMRRIAKNQATKNITPEAMNRIIP